MGPIETLYIVIILFFGAIGIIRGYPRELGVTTMLLISLFLISFINERLGNQVDAVLTGFGVSEGAVMSTRAIIYSVFLLIMAFISYQGVILLFPGSGGNWFLSLLVGLINGYLLAGSIWYFLQEADWPLTDVVRDYTPLYEFLVQLLPPAILSWPYFIILATALLILRVLK